jgi:hypothetical protein
MRRVLRVAMLSLVVALAPLQVCATGHPVADEAAAIRLAEKVMVSTYGGKQIESEKPLSAKLEGNVWIVSGSMPQLDLGGVAEVRIDRRNGRILRVVHGK